MWQGNRREPGGSASAAWLALLVSVIVYGNAGEAQAQQREACMTVGALGMKDMGPDGLKSEAEVEVYEQQIAGAERKEVMARGLIDAPSWQVLAAILDYDNYEEFMPYTVESRTIRKAEGAITVLQRLEFSKVAFFLSQRIYVIDVLYEEKVHQNYPVAWTLADDSSQLPSREGVVPVVNDGYWELVPIGDGAQTLASYCVDTDPGGFIPAFVANFATSNALPEVIEAVRARVKSHAYDSFAPQTGG